jgi:transcriptional regulator with XRE-family HTH domain
MKLGLAIKEHINSRGITQKYLSQKTGIDAVTLSTILNGKRRIQTEEYFDICHVLKVPLETFDPHRNDVQAAAQDAG